MTTETASAGTTTDVAAIDLKWMDSDMHLVESTTLWHDYMDPEYRDWLPVWSGIEEGDHPLRSTNGQWTVRGVRAGLAAPADPNDPDKPMAERRYPVIKPYLGPNGYVDPAGQLRAMD